MRLSSKDSAVVHVEAYAVLWVSFPRTTDCWKKKSLNPFTSWQSNIKILTFCWKTEGFPSSKIIAFRQSVKCFRELLACSTGALCLSVTQGSNPEPIFHLPHLIPSSFDWHPHVDGNFPVFCCAFPVTASFLLLYRAHSAINAPCIKKHGSGKGENNVFSKPRA